MRKNNEISYFNNVPDKPLNENMDISRLENLLRTRGLESRMQSRFNRNTSNKRGIVNKLEIYLGSEVKVIYYDNKGGNHEGEFGEKTNPFKLLYFLAKNYPKCFTAKEIADEKCLNDKRSDAGVGVDKKRISSTIQEIREGLSLNEDGTPFAKRRGEYGIACPVEFIKEST